MVGSKKMMLQEEFNECVLWAYDNEEYDEACEWLKCNAPSDNIWYYRKGFFCVDVVKEDYDSYIDFVEKLTGCSYCYNMNSKGITLMMSLSTLYNKIPREL